MLLLLLVMLHHTVPVTGFDARIDVKSVLCEARNELSSGATGLVMNFLVVCSELFAPSSPQELFAPSSPQPPVSHEKRDVFSLLETCSLCRVPFSLVFLSKIVLCFGASLVLCFSLPEESKRLYTYFTGNNTVCNAA